MRLGTSSLSILFFLSFLALLWVWRSSEPRKVFILSTAQTNGYVSSSGNRKYIHGGMARRASLIKFIRAQNDAAILVDAGNFGSKRGRWAVSNVEAEERTTFVWDMMSRLDYDVVTPGDHELILGLPSLKELYSRHEGIKVVSANLQDKEGDLIFSPWTVIKRKGVKIGVTGITDHRYYDFNLQREFQKEDDFTFRDMRGSLVNAVNDLRGKADVIVVLAHGPGRSDLSVLLDGIQGIDMVVSGHNPGLSDQPDTVGQTLVIRAGSHGDYLGVVQFSAGRPLHYVGGALGLDGSVPKDVTIDSLVRSFEGKNPTTWDRAQQMLAD